MLPPLLRPRVITYITRGDRLLVFRHTQVGGAGVQVPGGAVEPDEALDQAALREAHEETGLDHLVLRGYLGEDRYDMSAHGQAGVQPCHFFHLELAGDAPDTWRHYELHPSDGSPAPIEFEYYWVRYADRLPALAGNQAAFLHLLPLA